MNEETESYRLDGVPRDLNEREGDEELYKRMYSIRSFENAVQALFLKSEIYGTTHLYSGQEASGVGVISSLGADDIVSATFRSHGAALALGTTEQQLMDEMCGRATGVCGGRAGSMNIIDQEHGLLGSFGIVGASMGAAVGAGLSFKMQGLPRVSVAFFGDGAVNQAYFAECMNFAQVEKLPVLFICENNLYMEYTRTTEVTAGKIIDRPRAFGINSEVVDGNNVWAVREATRKALGFIQSGEGPVFLENQTYRLVGHSRSDPAKYRKPGELDEWKLKEPLVIARQELGARHGISSETVDGWERDIDARIAAVSQKATEAPWPDPSAAVREFAS